MQRHRGDVGEIPAQPGVIAFCVDQKPAAFFRRRVATADAAIGKAGCVVRVLTRKEGKPVADPHHTFGLLGKPTFARRDKIEPTMRVALDLSGCGVDRTKLSGPNLTAGLPAEISKPVRALCPGKRLRKHIQLGRHDCGRDGAPAAATSEVEQHQLSARQIPVEIRFRRIGLSCPCLTQRREIATVMRDFDVAIESVGDGFDLAAAHVDLQQLALQEGRQGQDRHRSRSP